MATMLRSPAERGDHPADLYAVRHDDCALAIWDRTLPAGLAEHIAELDPESVDDIDALVPSDAATLAAAVLLGAAGYESATALAFAAEIGTMADCLALVSPADRLRVRLEVVETAACRRFHADVVAMRMICTLRGPGTQWIETDKPNAIEEVPTGAVAIFKGRLLMPEPAILHRSPPIAGTGVQRLVLVIDPVRDDVPPPPALPAPVT